MIRVHKITHTFRLSWFSKYDGRQHTGYAHYFVVPSISLFLFYLCVGIARTTGAKTNRVRVEDRTFRSAPPHDRHIVNSMIQNNAMQYNLQFTWNQTLHTLNVHFYQSQHSIYLITANKPPCTPKQRFDSVRCGWFVCCTAWKSQHFYRVCRSHVTWSWI